MNKNNLRLVLEKNNIFEGSDYEFVHEYENPRIHIIGHLYHPHTRHELRDMIYDTLQEEEFNVTKVGKYWIEVNPQNDNVLYLKRVAYGKKGTPKRDREYRTMDGESPVGNVEEWKSFARFHGIKKLVLLDQDTIQTINL